MTTRFRPPAFRPTPVPVLAWLAIAAILAAAAIIYQSAYDNHFAVRYDSAFPQWWQWTDQGRYYRAAKAWTTFDLNPSQHWYPEGYPLLGALFFALDAGHPFYWPDLFCLLATFLLLTRLGKCLIDPPWVGRLSGALTFIVAVLLPPLQLKAFIEPWNTIPTTPLTFAAFLAAFRLWDRPTTARATGVGLATAAITFFRPSDVIPVALPLAAFTVLALPSPNDTRIRLAAAALAGAAIPIVLTAATYLAVFGWHRSPYLEGSAATGFEWRLIPLRWVLIFVSAMPAYPEEHSLAQTFLWIVPGITGMVAALCATSGRAWWRHAAVISAAAMHIALYLAYRDMHLQGLFRFGNYHYFQWCLPVVALYAVHLVVLLVRCRFVPVAAGLAAALVLFSWRMTWREISAPWLAEVSRPDPHTLILPRAPRSVFDGLRIPASGGLAPIFLIGADMQVGDRHYSANNDTKAIPGYGDLIFTVLRPIKPGATAVIRFNGDVTLTPGPLHMLHAHLFWRWPHPLGVLWFYSTRWLDPS